ncbi:MAG: hypothetical protein ACK4YL_13430 [Microcystis sp.]|jgi:hypothetical protein|uniref:Uncharacterized protein n=1 Tax=Microcystis flos-aquae Mf_QC_C_20070823_S10D TaxID=2486236 RepID=A0A552L289_9CHRO|nr:MULTISPECIES: hypothetical protein [unclassified Microcystis]MCA2815772.1 hypothetical protein [Microcystis sp. M085S1]MCA2854660.1 hypothetical protein [Microcystis sp. M065S1]MCZ8056404.1 hypothetical protein [Microcystis sp. LE19-12.2C]MDJ0552735.1 hypothetical protein [Microcystis sp. M49637_WE12]TRT77921.1 MAG: hypothetical protein EWV64_08205 [Microcystis flos-aquae Ma_QC_C_20070823_S18]TRT98714.1 MAG: hypothetical protein EWV65_09510 [Microcystis flos-aquae Ma_QC_C_20070823_S18D]TR
MSPEDEKVVNFLRRYRPSLPPRPIDQEEQLMQMIRGERPVTWPKSLPLLGWITGITALSVLIVASYRWSDPHPQLGQISDEQLEAFLVESWNHSIAPPIAASSVYSSPWMSLNEPQLTYSTYNP